MFCRKCGAINDDNAFRCVQCGEVLQDVTLVQPGQQLPEVASHLALAILVSLCCCLPLGIVSIVYAAQVNSKLEAGNYIGALDCSKKAAIWGWSGFAIGIIWSVTYTIINVIYLIAQHRNFQFF